MSSEVDEAIRNALNVEIKQRCGEAAHQRNSITVTLVEHPRDEKEGPDQPRLQVMVKALHPIQLRTAVAMLEEAVLQFQRNTHDQENTL